MKQTSRRRARRFLAVATVCAAALPTASALAAPDQLSLIEDETLMLDRGPAVQAQTPQARELVSVAKAFIGHYGAELVHDCVQMHGGIGVTFEHDLHFFVRRHTVNRALYGTPADHRQRIAELVL